MSYNTSYDVAAVIPNRCRISIAPPKTLIR